MVALSHAPATPSCRGHAHPYLMTSSARKRSVEGIVRPSAWAVFRLITSLNRIGCSTGRSAGCLRPLCVSPPALPHGISLREAQDKLPMVLVRNVTHQRMLRGSVDVA